jgi:adenylate cyclase
MSAAAQEPDGNAVRAELGRILASDDFDVSARNRHFLRYVVEETLAGRASRIKAYSIATSVFGRDTNFDPQLDSIVRIEAGRLRRALDRYYLTCGHAGDLRITIPRGAYVPVFVAGAAVGTSDGERVPPAAAGPKVPGRPGCAILVQPFEEEGDQSAHPNVTRGLMRQVIVGLTRFTDLLVYGIETTLSRAAGPKTPDEPLNVDLLLTGGTTVTADRFTLEVLLSDARTGRYIWGETFDRRLDPGEITRMRDEVANSVVRSLAQPYGVIYSERARDAEGKPAGSLSSYESVLLFHQYWRTYDRSLFRSVRDALEATIRRDPDYAEAFACLSQIYSNWLRFGHDPAPAALDPRERALALARRAIELAPHSSRGHHAMALAYWFSGDVAASLAALQSGLALNPNDTEIMADLGLRHALLMHWDKALPLLEGAYARNPAQPGNYWIGLALHHYMQGRYEQALVEMRRANPEHVVHGFIVVAAAAARLGRRQEAEAAVQSILRIAPGYGDRVIADLKARNVHPEMIAALVDGLRQAGLAGRDTGLPTDAMATTLPRSASGLA